MKRTVIAAVITFSLIAATAFANNCYTFWGGCGDLPVCSGKGWQDNFKCTVDFCEDTVSCQIPGATVWTNYSRTRDKFKRQTEEHGWEYCVSGTYSQTVLGCCTCDGVAYPQ